MKNLVLILSVAISLSLLTGCEEDNPPPPPPPSTPDDFVGYWNMTKIVKDGVDLTDDCTTQSYMSIIETNSFSGKDYDFEQNDCVLTIFTGNWEYLDINEYTCSIWGNEFIMELDVDTIRAEFIHAFDGQHYIEEYVRQE